VELIIPSYNRPIILMDTLQSIRKLYPELKICLGIQGDLPTDSRFNELKEDVNLRFELLPVPSLTTTLNHCIRTSNADIVLVLDDDAVPFFNFVESHRTAFVSDPGLAFTTGREVRFEKKRSAFSEWIRIMVEFLFGLFIGADKKINGRIIGWTTKVGIIFGNFDQPGTCKINTPRGCNMAFRRDFFLQIGGFNESFRSNAWGNESHLGWRLTKQGKYGRYLGDALAIHREVSTGGCRETAKQQGFKDFLFNNMLLIDILGPQAWLGSFPRLIKKRFFY
jgi:GT2 family glycosyltransferase